MRKWIGSILFLSMIVLSIFTITQDVFRIQLDEYGFDDILKINFVYYSKSEIKYSMLNTVNIIGYFGSLIFGYLFLMQDFFCSSRKYRRMLLIRFQKKGLLFRKFIINGLIKSLILAIIFASSIYGSIYPYRERLIGSSLELVHFVLRIGNLFLFFNIMTLITFIGYIFFDGGKTLLFSGSFIGFILIVDMFLPFTSILVYGKSLNVEFINIITQLVCYTIIGILTYNLLKLVEW